MTSIIVAFSKAEDAKHIKSILMRSGFPVVAVCTSGSQVLSHLDALNDGIVISGYRFEDMMFRELHDCLPRGFEMLLLASPVKISGDMPENMISLSMPLKVQDFLDTLDMMVAAQMIEKKEKLQQRARNEEERRMIDGAKTVLMERNNMTEAEAHRYIQKCSMDSGTNMAETAQMVMSLMNL